MKFSTLTKALLLAGIAAVSANSYAGPVSSGKAVKQVIEPQVEESWWHANLSAGWDSRYIFRGVDVINNSGLVSTDFNVTAKGFTLGGWYASGLNQDYTEFDLYASYAWALGPVDVSGGYILYLYPTDSAKQTSEFFASVSTTKICPYVTPSISYYYDIDAIDGSYLEFKLASSFPVIKDVVSIDPYALVSWSFQYNFPGDGWNNFQAGINIPYHINKTITVSGYGAVSVPIDSLTETQDTDVWGGVKVTFSF